MTSRLVELAGLVERLTGPCRETDIAIWRAVRKCRPSNDEMKLEHTSRSGDYDCVFVDSDVHAEGYCLGSRRINFTASLDAAMTLVPDGHAFYVRRNCSSDRDLIYCNAQVWPYSGLHEDAPHHFANSSESHPAIALTAASLRALAASESSHGE